MIKNEWGKELLAWKIPEYEEHERGILWYIIAIITSLAFLFYAFYSHNYLFAIIIFLFMVIYTVNHFREPDLLNFIITSEGIIIGNKFYDYDLIKNFSIVYKPKQNVEKLYLEFNSVFHPRLSIPLMNTNPLAVRDQLVKYLLENLERTDEANTDFIIKKLKL